MTDDKCTSIIVMQQFLRSNSIKLVLQGFEWKKDLEIYAQVVTILVGYAKWSIIDCLCYYMI